MFARHSLKSFLLSYSIHFSKEHKFNFFTNLLLPAGEIFLIFNNTTQAKFSNLILSWFASTINEKLLIAIITTSENSKNIILYWSASAIQGNFTHYQIHRHYRQTAKLWFCIDFDLLLWFIITFSSLFNTRSMNITNLIMHRASFDNQWKFSATSTN